MPHRCSYCTLVHLPRPGVSEEVRGGVTAGPVYELLGKKGLGTSKFPAQETALTDGEIAFRQHAGGHTTGPNWPTFLKFADRYIKVRRP